MPNRTGLEEPWSFTGCAAIPLEKPAPYSQPL